MIQHLRLLLSTSVIAIALSPAASTAASLLSPNDAIIAIDIDPFASHSTPGGIGEDALSAIDGNASSKYVNLAKPPVSVGLIVEPFFNLGTVVQSIQFTTANESPHRDPAGWKLYGTNDPITSAAHGSGSAENWNLIAESALNLPADRNFTAPAQSFPNSTPYDNYRILITEVRDVSRNNGMQFAEVQLFTGPNATGVGVFTAADLAYEFQLPQPDSSYAPLESPSRLIDVNPPSSRYVENESPQLLFDGDTSTKYFNFGAQNAGFIVTPQSPAQVQSMVLTSAIQTAATAVNRHPTSWVLYGTNDLILSTDNSAGTAENWTLIDSGSIPVPNPWTGGQDSPLLTVNNPNTYSSYKMLLPTTNNPTANGVHLSEARFYTSADGSGSSILHTDPAPSILAVDPDPGLPQSTKYFNAGGANSGFIVTPAAGTTIVDGFQLSTANDAVHRDPATWELYGTNDTIVSTDNSQGNGETWSLIASGAFTETEVPSTRLTQGGVVSFANAQEFKSYRMIFPTLRDPSQNNGMQISDLQFFGTVTSPATLGDYNGDGLVNAADYTVWRDTQNQSGSGLAADGNGDGTVNQADYDLWRVNYGANYAAAASVPEPAAVLTFVAGLLTAATTRRRV